MMMMMMTGRCVLVLLFSIWERCDLDPLGTHIIWSRGAFLQILRGQRLLLWLLLMVEANSLSITMALVKMLNQLATLHILSLPVSIVSVGVGKGEGWEEQ